jgi:hypothetical protein
VSYSMYIQKNKYTYNILLIIIVHTKRRKQEMCK